jgi:hypothetical protein
MRKRASQAPRASATGAALTPTNVGGLEKLFLDGIGRKPISRLRFMSYRDGTPAWAWGWVVAIPYWLVVLPTTVLPAVRVRAAVVRARRRGRGFCPACGYDLRATPDRCPECGEVPTNLAERAVG